MTRGATPMEMVSAPVAVRPPASVTCTVKWKLPLLAGVPLITPEEESVSPGGSEPDPGTTIQVKGDWPPVGSSDCEYGVPTVPLGSEVVATERPLATNKMRFCVMLSPVASLRITGNWKFPELCGVPVMAPVEVMLKPILLVLTKL